MGAVIAIVILVIVVMIGGYSLIPFSEREKLTTKDILFRLAYFFLPLLYVLVGASFFRLSSFSFWLIFIRQ